MRLTLRILLVAAAVLLTGLSVSKHLKRSSTGFLLELPGHTSRSQCGDFEAFVLEISKQNSVRINSEAVSNVSLRSRLREIYGRLGERVLFVKADPDVSLQDVAGVIDTANGAVTNLYVVLVTPEAEKEPCLFIKRPFHP